MFVPLVMGGAVVVLAIAFHKTVYDADRMERQVHQRGRPGEALDGAVPGLRAGAAAAPPASATACVLRAMISAAPEGAVDKYCTCMLASGRQ